MYKKPRFYKTDIRINQSTIGESIETKIARFLETKEPIDRGAPIIYQERNDGVQPQFNIRTDRFEIAIEATDKIARSFTARREERGKTPETETTNISEAEPTQTT